MADQILPILARWAHILAAIVAVGGTLFQLLALAPAARQTLDGETRGQLQGALVRRWRVLVHACIALLLASGLYNYLVILSPQHSGQALYHALLGTKMILAFAVFALAIALTSSKPWAASIQAKRPRWTAVLATLAIAVVLISGVARAVPLQMEEPQQAEEPAGAEETD